MLRALLLAIVCAAGCHRGEPTPATRASCLIEHDGGATQCFDEVGPTAKKFGAKLCGEMHGDHTYRVDQPCPAEGVVGSCTKGGGTDSERVERCYHDAPGCERRCQRSAGVFVP